MELVFVYDTNRIGVVQRTVSRIIPYNGEDLNNFLARLSHTSCEPAMRIRSPGDSFPEMEALGVT